MRKKRALFLCTGNSARSQMSEGLVNALFGERWEAYSAGTAPSGQVHPLAIEAMRELDIDITSHSSKSTAVFQGQPFDLVVTVCDNAAKNCPLWLGGGRVIHMGFPDPAAVEGSSVQRLDVFRSVRNQILHRLDALLTGNEDDAANPGTT